MPLGERGQVAAPRSYRRGRQTRGPNLVSRAFMPTTSIERPSQSSGEAIPVLWRWPPWQRHTEETAGQRHEEEKISD